MLLALILVPAVAGLAAFTLRHHGGRRALLVTTALAHAGMTASCWLERPTPLLHGWLRLDDLGLLFLSITSALFLAASVYAVGYLRREVTHERRDFQQGLLFTNEPE